MTPHRRHRTRRNSHAIAQVGSSQATRAEGDKALQVDRCAVVGTTHRAPRNGEQRRIVPCAEPSGNSEGAPNVRPRRRHRDRFRAPSWCGSGRNDRGPTRTARRRWAGRCLGTSDPTGRRINGGSGRRHPSSHGLLGPRHACHHHRPGAGRDHRSPAGGRFQHRPRQSRSGIGERDPQPDPVPVRPSSLTSIAAVETEFRRALARTPRSQPRPYDAAAAASNSTPTNGSSPRTHASCPGWIS